MKTMIGMVVILILFILFSAVRKFGLSIPNALALTLTWLSVILWAAYTGMDISTFKKTNGIKSSFSKNHEIPL